MPVCPPWVEHKLNGPVPTVCSEHKQCVHAVSQCLQDWDKCVILARRQTNQDFHRPLPELFVATLREFAALVWRHFAANEGSVLGKALANEREGILSCSLAVWSTACGGNSGCPERVCDLLGGVACRSEQWPLRWRPSGCIGQLGGCEWRV